MIDERKFRSCFFSLFFFSMVFLGNSFSARAWESRGHQIICESAAFLVENPELKKFLKSRVPTLAHLCNIPDTLWRSLGAEINSLGSPTHYFNPEVVGLPIHDFPLDFKILQDHYEGQAAANSIPQREVAGKPSTAGANPPGTPSGRGASASSGPDTSGAASSATAPGSAGSTNPSTGTAVGGDPFANKPRKIISLATDMGTLWWRVDQFVRRAIDFGKHAVTAAPPTNRKEEQQTDLDYNRTVLEMLVNMGILGHFVGDASQPLHSVADYDGYAQGHGGIHGFYEGEAVGVQDEFLTTEVISAARKLLSPTKDGGESAPEPSPRKTKSHRRMSQLEKYKARMPKDLFLRADSTLAKMRALSAISADEVSLVLRADRILEKSVLKLESGMEIKTPAKRPSVAKSAANFRPLIVRHMARSAALLALLWDEIYKSAGQPKLAPYKWYQFPFEPEFVAPDYIPKRK